MRRRVLEQHLCRSVRGNESDPQDRDPDPGLLRDAKGLGAHALIRPTRPG